MIRRLIILLLIVGCSTNAKITFTEHRSNAIFEGKGGLIKVKVVDGVYFWEKENRHPNQKYKILGIIDYYGDDETVTNSKKDGKIATKCKEFNCDGVILISEGIDTITTHYSDDGDDNVTTQSIKIKHSFKYEVIQYIVNN